MITCVFTNIVSEFAKKVNVFGFIVKLQMLKSGYCAISPCTLFAGLEFCLRKNTKQTGRSCKQNVMYIFIFCCSSIFWLIGQDCMMPLCVCNADNNKNKWADEIL